MMKMCVGKNIIDMNVVGEEPFHYGFDVVNPRFVDKNFTRQASFRSHQSFVVTLLSCEVGEW